jgi:hypothetical protein
MMLYKNSTITTDLEAWKPEIKNVVHQPRTIQMKDISEMVGLDQYRREYVPQNVFCLTCRTSQPQLQLETLQLDKVSDWDPIQKQRRRNRM